MAEIENLKIGNGTLHIVGNEDIIANEWEAGQSYIKDRSYVIREHKLLMCNVTHTSTSPFDPTKWTEKNIGEALGTAGSANMIECTLAEYTAWKVGGQLINETVYIITDAPNLNETAQDISYNGGATTVHDEVENVKSNTYTKTEVDTSLSNKADKTLTAFNLTAGTGITLQYVNCFAFGNLKVISANILVGSGATTIIATAPSGYSASNATFFYLGRNGGNGAYGYMSGTTLRTDSALSTGNYTINFVYR